MTALPVTGPTREETVVVNGESLPLMRDGRFPVFAYFPEGTKLFNASTMPPALVPLNGVKTWALTHPPVEGAIEISDDEDNDAELGVTVFRLVPFAPYIAVTAPIFADEVSKPVKDATAASTSMLAFESHEALLLASAPGRTIVETGTVVAPRIAMTTATTPSKVGGANDNDVLEVQQPALAGLASNHQLLQETYASYSGMNPDLSAFTPALSIAETLEVFETMSDLVQRWKTENNREPLLGNFSSLDDLSTSVPVVKLPERVNCHALKLLMYKTGRVAEFSVVMSDHRPGPGNASAALYNCPRSPEQLEVCIRKVSFNQPMSLAKEHLSMDNRSLASRGAKTVKLDPYVAGLRLPAVWQGPYGECIVVPSRQSTVTLHEAPLQPHPHSGHRSHHGPQVRVGGHYGGHGGGGHGGGGGYQGNNYNNNYDRHNNSGGGSYSNGSPTSAQPYSSGSSASSPTGYNSNNNNGGGGAPPSQQQQQYPSYGSSGGSTAPGVHLPSHVRARAERASVGGVGGPNNNAVPSFRPNGVPRQQQVPVVGMSAGAAPYGIDANIETQMSAAAAPYQSTSNTSPAPEPAVVPPPTTASVKPFIPKPRSHQAAAPAAAAAAAQLNAPHPMLAGAPVAVGSTPPMQPSAAPVASIPPQQRGSQVPSRNRNQ